jgi:PLP dependent protein
LLGENYPEETLQKIELLKGQYNPKWHMIGHLQSRKIKLLFPSFNLIHSIDSLELARKLDGYCKNNELTIDVLIEVNISGELTKQGFVASTPKNRDLLMFDFDVLNSFKRLKIHGLMTMPPYAVFEAQNKECYNICRDLLEKLKAHFNNDLFSELSMGTSADFVTAIHEGATYVRVGEAIMGPRTYNNEE